MTRRWYISPADTPDIPGIVALYREAQGWLRDKDLDQWRAEPQVADRIRRDVTRPGGVRVIKDCAARLVGTFTVNERADPEFWWPEDEPATALYAHCMIVTRSCAGLGLGTAMLDWASLRATVIGKQWLRLDVWASNTRLHDYCRSQGFELVRHPHYPHRGSGALFQRAAGVVRGTGPYLQLDLPIYQQRDS